MKIDLCTPTDPGTCTVGYLATGVRDNDDEMERGFVAVYDSACNEIGRANQGGASDFETLEGIDIASTLPYKVIIDEADAESRPMRLAISYADTGVDSAVSQCFPSTSHSGDLTDEGERIAKRVHCKFTCDAE